jgi:hypothetical protein
MECIEPIEENLITTNFIHEVKIYNELQNHQKILIFDLREKEHFQQSSLKFSLSLPHPDYPADFFANFDEIKYSELSEKDELKSIIKSYKRYYIVIIMSELKIKRKKILSYHKLGDHFIDKEAIRKSLLLYQKLVLNKVREIGLYNMGFKSFADNYYFIITRYGLPPISKYLSVTYIRDIANFPSEIFDHRIYIGTQKHVSFY